MNEERLWRIWLIILGGVFPVVQAPVFGGLSFDPFSFQQDGLVASEVDVGGCEIAQALVIALVIVVRDEGLDPVSLPKTLSDPR